MSNYSKSNLNFKIQKILFSLLLICAFIVPFSIAFASPMSGWGYENAPLNTPTDIESAVMNLTNYILGFVSMICVLVIFYGLVTGADTIKYGFLGLVVCGLAYAMVIVVSTIIL